jgi:hypothetical protein
MCASGNPDGGCDTASGTSSLVQNGTTLPATGAAAARVTISSNGVSGLYVVLTKGPASCSQILDSPSLLEARFVMCDVAPGWYTIGETCLKPASFANASVVENISNPSGAIKIERIDAACGTVSGSFGLGNRTTGSFDAIRCPDLTE